MPVPPKKDTRIGPNAHINVLSGVEARRDTLTSRIQRN